MTFDTKKDAQTHATKLRRQWPGAKFSIRGFTLGNKFVWEVTQMNRFG